MSTSTTTTRQSRSTAGSVDSGSGSKQTQYQPQQQEQHEEKQSEVMMLIDKYQTLSYLNEYFLVNAAVNTSVGLYNYAKSFSLLRMPMELSESTVGFVAKPIYHSCEPVINYADKFTVDKLTKVEKSVMRATEFVDDVTHPVRDYAAKKVCDTINVVDTTLDSVLATGQEKLQGSMLADLVVKSEKMAENIVDTILPPPSEEKEEQVDDAQLYHLEKRIPVLYKIRSRTNIESVMQIPSNTLKGLSNMTQVKPIKFIIDLLEESSTQIRNMTLTDVKEEVSKRTIEQIYAGLDTTAATIGSFALWVRRFNPHDALCSIMELTDMIKESKENIMQIADKNERVHKFKEDSARIMEKASQILKEQVEAGYVKIEEWKKSDIGVLRQTIYMVENAVQSIMSVIPSILMLPNTIVDMVGHKYKELKGEPSSSSSTPADGDSPTSTPTQSS